MYCQRLVAVGIWGVVLGIGSMAVASEPLSESFVGTRALGMGDGGVAIEKLLRVARALGVLDPLAAALDQIGRAHV